MTDTTEAMPHYNLYTVDNIHLIKVVGSMVMEAHGVSLGYARRIFRAWLLGETKRTIVFKTDLDYNNKDERLIGEMMEKHYAAN